MYESDGLKDYLEKLGQSDLDLMKYSDKELGKVMLTVSAGAVALSITFFLGIYQQSMSCIWLLIFSWIFLGSAISINVIVSHWVREFVSDRLHKRVSAINKKIAEKQEITSEFITELNDEGRSNHKDLDNKIKAGNSYSVYLFVFGLAFLIIFATVNIVLISVANSRIDRMQSMYDRGDCDSSVLF